MTIQMRLALLAGLLVACLPAGVARATQPAIEVEARAHLVAVRKPVISAEIPGRVVSIDFRAGQSFVRGSLLVAFDCGLHRLREARAQAQRDRAARQLASLQSLDRSGATSRLEVGLALAEVAAADAELRLAQQIAQRCEIRAPFAGAVVEARVQPGEYVTEGQPLIEILDNADLELEAIVPSRILAWLRERTVFEVDIDEIADRLQARLSRIAPLIDPVSQTVKIYARVDARHHSLLAGMSGRARFVQPDAGRP
jgi:membrane fusion protein, multidrug efflux system